MPEQPDATPILITIDDVAALLTCSPRTVHRLIDRGRIPRPIRFGRMLRWLEKPFLEWIADGCPTPH